MKVAIKEAQMKGETLLDMMILSVFEGDIDSKYIGENFYANWLEENMEMVYESPKFETKVKKSAESHHQATLKFIVYLRKQK